MFTNPHVGEGVLDPNEPAVDFDALVCEITKRCAGLIFHGVDLPLDGVSEDEGSD